MLWAVVLAALASAVAAGADPGQGMRLELMSFVAPVESQARSRRLQTTVVAYLDLAGDVEVERVCHMAPRLLDAFLEVLHDRGVQIQPDRTIDDGAVAPLLLSAARQALDTPDVERVILTNLRPDGMVNLRKLNASCHDLPAVDASPAAGH